MTSNAFQPAALTMGASIVSSPVMFDSPATLYVARGSTLWLPGYVSGGTPPHSVFTLVAGTLPSGITLNAATGNLTVPGNTVLGHRSGIKFSAKDASGKVAQSAVLRLTVYDSYPTLPIKGAAKMVSPKDASLAVRPAGMSGTEWIYALFGSYGSGVLNRYYSTKGAYVLAGSGGHDHPTFFGAAVFDYDTMQWDYLECANDGTRPRNGSSIGWAQTTGKPWADIITSAEVPAPGHPYKSQVVIPPSKGGSALGSMMYLGRSVVSGNVVDVGAVHSFDLATRKWKHQSDDTVYACVEGTALYDPVENYYYSFSYTPQYETKLLYLDGADWRVKSSARYSKQLPGRNVDGTPWIQEGGGVRALMLLKGSQLYGINLEAVSSGWSRMTVRGAPVASEHSSFVLHEQQNVLYRRLAKTQGQTLYRLIPPSANPLIGTWAHESLTLDGDTIADFAGYSNGSLTLSTSGYRSLMYIPALQMLGWVTASGVFLLNP